jgi:hypothetical protein
VWLTRVLRLSLARTDLSGIAEGEKERGHGEVTPADLEGRQAWRQQKASPSMIAWLDAPYHLRFVAGLAGG